MNWNIKILVLVIVCHCFIACQQEKVFSPKQYIRSVQKTHPDLIEQKETDMFFYEAQFIPPTYQALKGSYEEVLDKNKVLSAIEAHKEHLYISLKIKPQGTKSIKDILAERSDETALNRLQFHAQNQFKLLADQDTLACVLYHGESSPVEKEGMRFHLVFKDTQLERTSFNQPLQLIFEDIFLGHQAITFSFNERKLNRLPTLKL